MTDSVTVDQCDRDAAAKLAEECNPEEAEWLVPFYQNGGTSPLAAAFARHRIAERERCAGIAEDAHHATGLGWTPTAIAQAIREPKP